MLIKPPRFEQDHWKLSKLAGNTDKLDENTKAMASLLKLLLEQEVSSVFLPVLFYTSCLKWLNTTCAPITHPKLLPEQEVGNIFLLLLLYTSWLKWLKTTCPPIAHAKLLPEQEDGSIFLLLLCYTIRLWLLQRHLKRKQKGMFEVTGAFVHNFSCLDQIYAFLFCRIVKRISIFDLYS